MTTANAPYDSTGHEAVEPERVGPHAQVYRERASSPIRTSSGEVTPVNGMVWTCADCKETRDTREAINDIVECHDSRRPDDGPRIQYQRFHPDAPRSVEV